MQPSKYTQELFRSTLSNFEQYVNNLHLPSEIKSTLCSNINHHSSYYLFYPYLFKDAFKTANSPNEK